jgi:hypothetical protein
MAQWNATRPSEPVIKNASELDPERDIVLCMPRRSTDLKILFNPPSINVDISHVLCRVSAWIRVSESVVSGIAPRSHSLVVVGGRLPAVRPELTVRGGGFRA